MDASRIAGDGIWSQCFFTICCTQPPEDLLQENNMANIKVLILFVCRFLSSLCVVFVVICQIFSTGRSIENKFVDSVLWQVFRTET